MANTSGFYTLNLKYAKKVYGPDFTLTESDKDSFVYPFRGWTWYASREDAVAATLAIAESDEIKIEQRRISLVVQDVLDAQAQLLGFDNIFTAVTYVDDKNKKFAEDAKKLKIWRSDVWTKCYQILNDVMAGKIAKPTDQELLAMLPRY